MSKRKLLLADDSVTIQKVVNLTFADEGIDVITVSDGDSAVAKISEISPDIILADVHMPGLSGYEICEIVRENPDVVVFGHTHKPFCENIGNTLFLNPGYAGKQRFKLKRTVAVLHCDEQGMTAEFHEL